MYVVLSGCLGVYSSRHRLIGAASSGRIVAGDTAGEMGLISGRPRTGTVIALRDTELARLSREAFDRVFRRHPEAMLRIAQLTVDRLETRTAADAGTPARCAHVHDTAAERRRRRRRLRQRARESAEPVRPSRAGVERARRRCIPATGSSASKRPTISSCTSAEPAANSVDAACACARPTR